MSGNDWCVSHSCLLVQLWKCPLSVLHLMAPLNTQTLAPLRCHWLTHCHNVLPDDGSNRHLRIVLSMFLKPTSQLLLRFKVYMHMSLYQHLWFIHAVKVQPSRYYWKWLVNFTQQQVVQQSSGGEKLLKLEHLASPVDLTLLFGVVTDDRNI